MTCDCGWSFTREQMAAPRRFTDEAHDASDLEVVRARARRQLAVGVAMVMIGGVITLATYGSAAGGGGTYIIAYGPIIFGVIRIVRSLSALSR